MRLSWSELAMFIEPIYRVAEPFCPPFPWKISSMREEEKVLRQKLSDAEKARKQLQSEVACRERSIQQLRTVSDAFPPSPFINLKPYENLLVTLFFVSFHTQEQTADSKSTETARLYQKACGGRQCAPAACAASCGEPA